MQNAKNAATDVLPRSGALFFAARPKGLEEGVRSTRKQWQEKRVKK